MTTLYTTTPPSTTFRRSRPPPLLLQTITRIDDLLLLGPRVLRVQQDHRPRRRHQQEEEPEEESVEHVRQLVPVARVIRRVALGRRRGPSTTAPLRRHAVPTAQTVLLLRQRWRGRRQRLAEAVPLQHLLLHAVQVEQRLGRGVVQVEVARPVLLRHVLGERTVVDRQTEQLHVVEDAVVLGFVVTVAVLLDVYLSGGMPVKLALKETFAIKK